MKIAKCRIELDPKASLFYILQFAFCILHSNKKPLPENASGSGFEGFDFWPVPQSDKKVSWGGEEVKGYSQHERSQQDESSQHGSSQHGDSHGGQ